MSTYVFLKERVKPVPVIGFFYMEDCSHKQHYSDNVHSLILSQILMVLTFNKVLRLLSSVK